MNSQPNLAWIARTAALCSFAFASVAALAGPLNPPFGPVRSTHKTLTEVEPRIAINATNTPGDPLTDASPSLFKIDTPGSYYLTGNITGVAGKHGIEITTSGVTLDLNGFTLDGIEGMGSFDGIAVTVVNLQNIAVVNGSVRGWGRRGIDLDTTGSTLVSKIRVSGNVSTGIDTGGSGCVVTECSASDNNIGITVGLGSTITACTANGNASTGITTSFACVISRCSAYSNGADGFSAGNGSSITDCAARANTLHGIRVSSGKCLIRGNVCTDNDAAGIAVSGAGSRIEDNSCVGNLRGIDVGGTDNIIIRNTCSANTSMNWDINAGNHYGPIIDRTAINPPAVQGNAATEALGSTHPNANFTY